MNFDHMPQTIEEAVAKWKKNDIVNTVEMGGLGPGYEQAIQIGVFTLAGKLIKKKLPQGNDAVLNDFLNKLLHECIKEQKALDGLSGAQAGAIKNLAYHFVKDGYIKTLKEIGDKDPERIILVNKDFPA